MNSIHRFVVFSFALALPAAAAQAAEPVTYTADFESADFTPLTFFAGDEQAYRLVTNVVTSTQARTGKHSWMMDISTTGGYSKHYLYFSSPLNRLEPKPGQRIEGWLKIGEQTSPDLRVKLGLSVIYPNATAKGADEAQFPLEFVQKLPDGWIKFQSAELVGLCSQIAREQHWNASGLYLDSWLLHITADEPLKDKRVVVYFDDVVLR